jgi:hypothetical protein
VNQTLEQQTQAIGRKMWDELQAGSSSRQRAVCLDRAAELLASRRARQTG